MADEPIIVNRPSTGFGSMTREEMIEMAKHPPAPEADRGGRGADPLGFTLKESQLAAMSPAAQQLHAANSAVGQRAYHLGQRAYHRKKKIEVTIAAAANGDRVDVVTDDGTKFSAKVKNITLL